MAGFHHPAGRRIPPRATLPDRSDIQRGVVEVLSDGRPGRPRRRGTDGAWHCDPTIRHHGEGVKVDHVERCAGGAGVRVAVDHGRGGLGKWALVSSAKFGTAAAGVRQCRCAALLRRASRRFFQSTERAAAEEFARSRNTSRTGNRRPGQYPE
jgi:hypothetical protein